MFLKILVQLIIRGLSALIKQTSLKTIQCLQDCTYLAPGYTIGYLEQEPYLEPGKTVMEIVKEGVKPITDLLEEFDKINEAFGDPDADFDKLCARQGEIQEKLDALDAWNLDNNLELAMDALRCPPADQVVDVLSTHTMSLFITTKKA